MEQTDALVNAWKEHIDEVDNYISPETWRKILRMVNKKGPTKTIRQAKKKIRNLKDRYKVLKSQNRGFSVRHLQKYNYIFDDITGSKLDDLPETKTPKSRLEDSRPVSMAAKSPGEDRVVSNDLDDEMDGSNQAETEEEANSTKNRNSRDLPAGPSIPGPSQTITNAEERRTDKAAEGGGKRPHESRLSKFRRDDEINALASLRGTEAVVTTVSGRDMNGCEAGLKNAAEPSKRSFIQKEAPSKRLRPSLPERIPDRLQDRIPDRIPNRSQPVASSSVARTDGSKLRRGKKRKGGAASQLTAVLKAMQKQQEDLTKQFLEGLQKIEEESRKHTEQMILKVAKIFVDGKVPTSNEGSVNSVEEKHE